MIEGILNLTFPYLIKSLLEIRMRPSMDRLWDSEVLGSGHCGRQNPGLNRLPAQLFLGP